MGEERGCVLPIELESEARELGGGNDARQGLRKRGML